MYPFEYSVSLRFRHPSIDPRVISEQLGKNPSRSWKTGERRTTPKGQKLKGFREETYWTSPLHSQRTLNDRKANFEKFIMSVIDELEPHKRFINKLINGGGEAELFIGLFGTKDYGFGLRHEYIKRFGNIGVGISICIYPKYYAT